ncbi:hypothetical protein [Thiovibrio frasassiensis]|uniref:Uncharacterized protein n=1 Tax=Thiovibrio frasassiensis TaxID=2984131 RepID=A0A9X4MFR9_9BACT|nr:hypothetical protein [Thiovibrio frasassiensis]MDG4475440.1 hypothetical protein [Thiovibrio frasassiensis]
MLEEKGTLPFGIERDGAVHRKYTLREQLVCDAIEVFDSDDAERAGKSDSFFGVCVMAQRLSVDGIPQEEITTALLMTMRQTDFNELAAADKRLEEKRRTFRGAAEAAAKAPDSVGEAGA